MFRLSEKLLPLHYFQVSTGPYINAAAKGNKLGVLESGSVGAHTGSRTIIIIIISLFV